MGDFCLEGKLLVEWPWRGATAEWPRGCSRPPPFSALFTKVNFAALALPAPISSGGWVAGGNILLTRHALPLGLLLSYKLETLHGVRVIRGPNPVFLSSFS